MRHEAYQAEDAEILLVGYGIVSRVLRSAVDEARKHRDPGRPVPSDFPVAFPVAGVGDAPPAAET